MGLTSDVISVILFQNKLFLLNRKTSDTTPWEYYFHYFIIFIHHLVFLCHLHHVFDSYEYIIVF